VIILVEEIAHGYAVRQVSFTAVIADEFCISRGIFLITDLDLDKIEDNEFYVGLKQNEYDTVCPEIFYAEADAPGDCFLTAFTIKNGTIKYVPKDRKQALPFISTG
jgi:hypothetical protein